MSITVGLRVAVHSQLPWQALTTSSNLLLQVDTPLDWLVEVNCHSLAQATRFTPTFHTAGDLHPCRMPSSTGDLILVVTRRSPCLSTGLNFPITSHRQFAWGASTQYAIVTYFYEGTIKDTLSPKLANKFT